MGTRTQILVRGIVQGVGFRPYIYSLASKRELKGKVINNETGVLIDVEGRDVDIEHFIDELRKNPPPLSQVESISRADNLESINFKDFQILPSESNGDLLAPVTPVASDSGTCRDCLAELFDPANRRYRYPFINCTNCGPRFTIVESVPYDRARTTMRSFNMCGACRAEYIDPANRRFHAEPTCCPECGPQVALTPGVSGRLPCAISDARELLARGKIVAIKGLGGYHLACDALNEEAVQRLRRRKYREDKPFALMANSVEVIRKYCRVSPAEEEVLLSAERPVVLLERNADSVISGAIAPGVRTLGFMLPYTPLHYLLLENSDGPLVMTSGNISDEPIAYEDSDARERLKNIADYYLLHNRRIHIRTDDSVIRVIDFETDQLSKLNGKSKIPNSKSQIVRRSRGYAPAPVKTSFRFHKQILACGAELKNTFCLARDRHAFISHHIGDLENLETLRSFTEGIEHFKNLFHLEPEVIAYDLHPEYLSTKYAIAAKEGDGIETKIGVQHHHAHIASCLADNRIEGEVIGVAMDGLGFGADGKLWGGEFFVADFQDAERVFHLDYIPMPGGAKAIREPWRMAASYLHRAYGDEFLDLDLPFVRALDPAGWAALRSMISAGTNSPETSSMGRLFDALSALLSLRNTVNYEGQAAIELEAMADRNTLKSYEFTIADGSIIKAEPVIISAACDLLNGVSPAEVSAKFHLGVAELIARAARQIRDERKLDRIALSGGVFQNMFLLERTVALLRVQGFEVFTHSRVPANDGGISLGQAAIANAQIATGRI